MAIIVNDKDAILQASTVRLLYSANNYIYFSELAPIFKIDKNEVVTPTSYTITAKLAGQLSGAVTWSVVSGTVTLTNQTGTSCTIVSTDMSTDRVVIRATLQYLGYTYTSDLVVSKVYDGDDAIIADLITKNDFVPVANDGTGYTFPTGNILRLYKGGALVTSGVTYSGTATKNGLTVTINSLTGAITLSGTTWTSNQESFVLTATYKTKAYTATYNIAKGRAGASAVTIDLVSESDVVFAANDGTGYSLPTGNSVKLYSGGSVISSGVTYGGTTTQSGLTITVDSATGSISLSGSSWTSTQEFFTVTATYSGVTYSTIYSIAKSRAGSDAVIVDLVSESDVVFAANDGTGYTLPSGNSLRLYKGGTLLSSGVTYSGTATQNGLTLTINTTTGVITLAGANWNTNQEVFSVTASYAGSTYTASYSIAKSKMGAAGSNGISIDLLSDSDVVTTASDGTGYTLPTGNSIKLYSGGTVLSLGVTYGGTATQNGLTVTVNSSTGAITLSGTNWTSNQETFTVTATYNSVLYSTIYSIAKSKAGNDAVIVDLVSESDVVAALSDGTGYTLPTGNSLKLYKGGALLSSGVTYSGTATQNGLTLTVNSTTGTITLSGSSWTSNQENFTVTATYSGVAYTASYSIAKSKSGATGSNGSSSVVVQLSNEAHVFPADSSGSVTSYTNSGTEIRVYEGATELTYDAVGTSTGTWKISATTTSNISVGTITDSGTYATVGQHSGVASGTDTSSITYTITGRNSQNTPFTLVKSQTFTKAKIGAAGQNGLMSAYPTIYQWTSGYTPTRPAVGSTYTWTNGTYTAPSDGSGWSTTVPSNTSAGYVLWSITIPLNVSATVTQSNLDWTSTAYAIRAISANGSNGAPGGTGDTGPAGSGTYLITRSANDSSQPTAAEVYSATGNKRYAVIGDIATINYNAGNNSVAYRATSDGASASWSLQSTYITGSLIVQNSISGDRIIANSLSANKLTSGTTSTLSQTSGTFSLGDQTFLVFPTTASFTANGAEKWAAVGYNYGTSGFCHGLGGGSSSDFGFGIVGYNSVNINTPNFRTVGTLGQSTFSIYGKNLKPSTWGAYYNNLANLNTEFGGGATEWGAITNSWYPNSGQVKFQCSLSPSGEVIPGQDFAAAFTKYSTSGSLVTQIFLATGGYAAYAASNGGKIYAVDGFTPFTGIHSGVLDQSVNVSLGDILVDIAVLAKPGISSTLLKQALSSQANQRGVIGVYSGRRIEPPNYPESRIKRPSTNGEQAGEIIIAARPKDDPYELKPTETNISFNALGEGLINVCGENGTIEVGDLIVSSNMPGKGMRQSDDIVRSYTVAKSRERVTFTSPTEVKQIACIYLCG